MIFKLFRKETAQETTANALYDAIVAQARQPKFYLDYGVEDSINGRFEMIVLHAYMLFHRLQSESEKDRALGQAVFNRFFQDMDDSLREIGVGDLSVPKKIKKMAQSFYGRIKAYDTARKVGADELAQALSRNVYPDDEQVRTQANDLAVYVMENAKILDDQTLSDFSAGTIRFAEIPDPV